MTGGALVDHLRMGRGSANGQSEVVVNEGSVDIDFRVESNGNANMLFVDGGNDRVGIGTNAPATGNGLVIQNTDGASGLVLHRDFSGSNVSSNTSSNRIEFTMSDSATANQTIALISPMAAVGSGDALGGILRFFTAGDSGTATERLRIDNDGRVTLASDGSTIDFTTIASFEVRGQNAPLVKFNHTQNVLFLLYFLLSLSNSHLARCLLFLTRVCP